MGDVSLAGRRILLVEDEYLIAQAVMRDLERESVVGGPAPSVERALRLVEDGPPIDAAILDLNLSGVDSLPLAEVLQDRAVPFVFATGYISADVPRQWQHVPGVEKPFRVDTVARLLSEQLDRAGRPVGTDG